MRAPGPGTTGDAMMSTGLAVGLWAVALAGVAAIVVAVVRPRVRRIALLAAATAFLPIGVLGILSVGAAFLITSVVCLVVAVRARPTSA